VAFFPLAKFAAKLLTTRKITTYVAILGSHPAITQPSEYFPGLLEACFSMGLRIAEHVHGVRRKGDDGKHNKMFEALHEIADGELTLLGTALQGCPRVPLSR
jgi:hypothetical protein